MAVMAIVVVAGYGASAIAATGAASRHAEAAGASRGQEPLLAAPTRAGSTASVQVGTQTLTRCGGSPAAYCGRLAVPLDYGAPQGPLISIAYRWYPAAAPNDGPVPAVVPVEGGPGYPSIGSVAGYYSVMYGALLQRSNMLVVDNRGTGDSTPLDCPALQDFSAPTGTNAFQELVGTCADALSQRWRYPGAGHVHASDLFTTAPAAEDLAAVITALNLPKIDLYGDSYGSFFAQAFVSRFPRLVRSVILDSTYETVGLDPWYRSSVKAMPTDFDAACSRAQACAAAASGSSWARIGALADRLRASPVSGRVPGPTGAMLPVSMNVVGLVDLVNDAAGDVQIYRELDASARALLDDHDPAPLLRLYAQRLAIDESYFGIPAGQYSDELYLAVGCLDYPQLFDMNAPFAARRAQLAAAEARLPPTTFAPFTTEEWLAQNQNTEAYSACLQWPGPTIAQPPTAGRLPLFPSSLPVLVLGGEFDSLTPPGDVPKVLAEIGGHARFIELANATHVVGEGDTVCGSTLVQLFVARPEAIDSLDGSCAAEEPAIHAVGVYAGRLSQEPPIELAPGTHAPTAALRLAAAAVSTGGDAVARYGAIEPAIDRGLFGGEVVASRGGTVLALDGDQLVPGVRVSGTLTLSAAADPADGKAVAAALTVAGPGVRAASFTARWTSSGTGAQAVVSGTVNGQPVSGTLPAP
jgi:pimeloyl-ACP methyl ester carboxylesterase